MNEDILSWPAIDVFYYGRTQLEGVKPTLYCTRVMAPVESVPKIADHYDWDVIGMVIV